MHNVHVLLADANPAVGLSVKQPVLTVQVWNGNQRDAHSFHLASPLPDLLSCQLKLPF